MLRRRLTVVSDGCDGDATAEAAAAATAAASAAPASGSVTVATAAGRTSVEEKRSNSSKGGLRHKGRGAQSSGGSGDNAAGTRGDVCRRGGGGVGAGKGNKESGGGDSCGAETGENAEKDEQQEEDDNRTISCVVSSYAGFSKRGYAPHNPRKHNQDAVIMAEDASTGSLFLAVLDGHGEFGENVAQAFRVGLVEAVFDHPDWKKSPEIAVAESISTIEQALLEDPAVDTSLSGTTLVSVCVRGSKLVLTNVGDSRATLGRRRVATERGEEEGQEGHGGGGKGGSFGSSLVAQPLTEDHKPDIPEEKERIIRAGGRVFALEYSDGVNGPPRVWLADVDVPGLAMSRTLGDVVAHSVGVTSDPDTYRCDLDDVGEAALLILATDGLWEFVTDQEAVDIASRCTEPREAVQKLTYEATNRWMKEEQVVDDITVCVAFLNDWKGEDTG